MDEFEFLDEYNKELGQSESEIDAGEFFSQDEVKELISNRGFR